MMARSGIKMVVEYCVHGYRWVSRTSPAPLLLTLPGDDSSCAIKPFTDLSGRLGLNTRNLAGGSIMEDFNNDGYVGHYYQQLVVTGKHALLH